MKYTFAFVGATSAALAPLPVYGPTGFPLFATAETPTATTEINAGGAYEAAYLTTSSNVMGTHRGYRNGLYIFPSQTIDKKIHSDTPFTSLCKANATGYRSWYEHDKTKLGTFSIPNAGTDAATRLSGLKQDSNARFVVCGDISTINKCNGRTYTVLTADPDDLAKEDERWVTYKTAGKANAVTFSDQTNHYQFQFNEDIVMAAQYHSAGTVTADTIWCSQWKTVLKKDGTKADSEAGVGFSKYGKCNWMYKAEEGTVAPTFKISETTISDFLLQYIEFYDLSALGTGGVLSTGDDSAAFFQGAYAVSTTDGPYLNPFMKFGESTVVTSNLRTLTDPMASASALSDKTEWWRYMNPGNWGAGSVGRARYHTQDAGAMKEYTTASGDISIFWGYQAYKKAENDQFNAKKTTFEDNKTKFVQALADRDAQLKDIFKAAFEAAVEIPDRPENFETPFAYAGPKFDLNQYTGGNKTWKIKASENAGNGGLVTKKDFNAVPAISEQFANRIGYLYASEDTSATAVSALGVGHVFGRLGQGTVTMPDNSKPVYWQSTSASKYPHMVLGMYPDTATTAIATGKTTKFEVKAKAFEDLSTFMLPPGVPAATSGACPQQGGEAGQNNAKYIALGTATALAIASSLY